MSTERVSVEAPVSPLEWRILVRVHRGDVSIGKIAEELGLVRAAQVIESLRQRRLLELRGERLVPISSGRGAPRLVDETAASGTGGPSRRSPRP